jgi:hypothetical protein
MAHTEGRYQQDLGFTDGRIFVGPGDVVAIGSTAAPAVTRNAAGDWSLTRTSAGAETLNIAANLTQAILRRTGFFEDIQNLFGAANPNAPAATAIPGSAQPSPYRPDVIGAMNTAQQIQPRTAFKLKGFKLLSIDAIYRVTVLALTTNTIRVDQDLQVNNTAPAITAILAPTGIPTATQANPYVSNTPLAAGQQIYRVSPDQSLWIEMTVAIPNTSKIDFYGFDCLCEFNFN